MASSPSVHLQVLWCRLVAEADRSVHVWGHHTPPVLRHGHTGHVGSGQVSHLPGESSLHLGDEGLVGCDKLGHGCSVMLGLGDEVRCHHLRICGIISQHQQLRGACQHVDGHTSSDHSLGSSHKTITWATDSIAWGQLPCTIGQCSDGLRPTHGQQALHPCDVRCR